MDKRDIGLDIMFSLYIFLFNNASPIYIYRNGDKYLYRYFLYVAKNLIKNNVWYDFSADENTCETQQRYFFLYRGQIFGHRFLNNAQNGNPFSFGFFLVWKSTNYVNYFCITTLCF